MTRRELIDILTEMDASHDAEVFINDTQRIVEVYYRSYDAVFIETEECRMCAKNEPGTPPHNASSGCESGKRNHCTCDVCY